MEFKKHIVNVMMSLLFFINASVCQVLSFNEIEIKTAANKPNEFIAYKINSNIPFTGIAVDNSGVDKIKLTYKNGKLNGPKEIFKNEIKVEECMYVDNKKDGAFSQYYDEGLPEVKGQFINDKEVGLWKGYYKSGKLQYSGTYVDGAKEEQWKYFDESGAISRIDFYSRNNFIKSFVYQNGKKQDSAISVSALSVKIKDGKKHYFKYNSDQPFNGLAFEIINDSLDKDLKKEFQIQNGKSFGRWTLFYKNNTIKATGFYNADGMMEGSYLEYHKNGKLKCEGEYRNDFKNGSWTFYAESGYYYLIGTMLDDMKHSVWRYFDEKGKLIREELYIFDVKQN
jgi:uncharacterized protein